MRFLPIVTAALLSLFCQTLAAPAPQASETLSPQPTTCRIPDYRSFKLWATRKDTGERYPVRLLREDWRNATVSDPSQAEKKELRSYAIVNTAKYEIEIYPCYSCGITPDKWTLKSQNLYAADYTIPAPALTINENVVDNGRLPFVAYSNPVPTAPIYCAVAPITAYGYPQLAVHGHTDLFVMCRSILTAPISPIYTIIYNPSIYAIPEWQCVPIILTLE